MSGLDDRDFDAYLRSGKRLLEQETDLTEHTLEPPPQLDAAILRHARQSIRAEAEDNAPRYITGSRWTMPVALAATLVLAFGIMWNLEPRPVLPGEAPVAAPEVAATIADSDQPAAGQAQAKTDEAEPPIASKVPQPREPAAIARTTPAPRAMPQPAARTAERPAAPPPPGANAAPALDGLAATLEDKAREDRDAAPRSEAAAVSAARREQTAAASEVASGAAASPDTSKSAAAAPNYRQDPERWLARIRELLDAGELAAAAEEARLFRESYPQRAADLP
ncbi:MAG: hypothetical protein R3E77_16240 [Steroidobacteraceae bacterium]